MNKLKLNHLAENTLSKKEMSQLNGGNGWSCSCSCYWADNGGSSTQDNGFANAEISGGGRSEHGSNEYEVQVIVIP